MEVQRVENRVQLLNEQLASFQQQVAGFHHQARKGAVQTTFGFLLLTASAGLAVGVVRDFEALESPPPYVLSVATVVATGLGGLVLLSVGADNRKESTIGLQDIQVQIRATEDQRSLLVQTQF